MNNNEELRKGSSVFFIDLNKIEVNPYQPRIEFDEEKLKALAESIKQYGILQPIVVSRKEEYSDEFGIRTKYQIIAGERRFRAAKIAGLKQIPAIIREKEDTDAEKLELAIIENLQREDLNPVDKAKAFKKLADEFGLKHVEIAKKMGKSREYVSNAMRILMLPEQILNGLVAGKISEGHTRSLLMLKDRPEEQAELYKRIIADKLTVRAAEKLARNIAVDKIRKKVDLDPEIKDIENHIREKLGTKVSIDQKPLGDGGKLTIEFFSKDDLRKILAVIESDKSVVQKTAGEAAAIVSTNFVEENQKTEEEVNNFEDIQPTVFKEEIEKIEQFGNVVSDNKKQDIDNWSTTKNNLENNSVSVSNISLSLDEEKEKGLSDGFQGFTIAPEDSSQSVAKEPSLKEKAVSEMGQNNFNSIADTTAEDFLKEKEEINNFGINNFENKVEEKNNDFSNNNNQVLSDDNDIRQEIENELGKLNSFSDAENKREINNFNLEQDKAGAEEGLQKIEIKNDFDRERINSFAKTDEILKSFGQDTISSLDNKLNQVEDNIHEVTDNINSKINNNNITEEVELESTTNEYSDLYAQFLKSKEGVKEDNTIDNIIETKDSVETMDNEIKLDSADNFVVRKAQEDLSANLITDNDPFKETNEDYKAEVDIITPDSSDFLAAAKEHDDIKDDNFDENQDTDSRDEKKSRFGFKGFSL